MTRQGTSVRALTWWGLALAQTVGMTVWYAVCAVDLDLRARDAFFEGVGTYVEPYRTATWLAIVGAASVLATRNARRASNTVASARVGGARAAFCFGAALTATLTATTAVLSRPGELAVESGGCRWQSVTVPECVFPLSASRFVVRAGDRTLWVPWILPIPVNTREWRSRLDRLACP